MSNAKLIMGIVVLAISIVLMAYWIPKTMEAIEIQKQAQIEYEQALLEQEQAFEELNDSINELNTL